MRPTPTPRPDPCQRLRLQRQRSRWTALALSGLCLLLLALAHAGPALASQPGQSQARRAPDIADAAPPPRFVAPGAEQAIELRSFDQQLHLVGQSLQTRLTLVLHNPNRRVLEGELQLPLAAGQAVTGFALDIDGELRRAVPVGKAKGLQVFEQIVRGQVDPALLEATGTNQYKLRVYPLPAGGQRRVTIDIAQQLPAPTAGHTLRRLQLPIGLAAMPATRATLRLEAAGLAPEALRWQVQGLPADALQQQATRAGSVLQMPARALGSPARLSLQLALPAGDAVQAARFDGETFIYAEVPLPRTTRPRPAPRTLALVWDASGSAAQRDIPAELALLDALFARWQNLRVELYLLRDRLEDPVAFDVKAGRWASLRQRLQAEPFDGGTQLGALRLPAGAADLALVFSDGQHSFGPRQAPTAAMPLFALQSGPNQDAGLLAAAAEPHGGAVIDLAQSSRAQTVARITRVGSRLVALRAAPAAASGETWLARQPAGGNGHLIVTGRTAPASGTLDLVFEDAAGRRHERRLPWLAAERAVGAAVATAATPAAPAESATGVASDSSPPMPALLWAGHQLAQLARYPERHAAEIERTGRRFGLASAGSSLIVLETLADYVRHAIEPPTGPLRQAWQQQRAPQQADLASREQAQLDRLARRWQERRTWWAADFPKDTRPAEPAEAPRLGGAVGSPAGGERREAQAMAPTARMAEAQAQARPVPPHAPIAAPAAPAPAATLAAAAEASAGPALRKSRQDAGTAGRASADRDTRSDTRSDIGNDAATEAASSRIALSKWEPDSASVKRLRAAAPDRRYAAYLAERPQQARRTAFFLDSADLFFAQGDAVLGLRVLSNLGEMAIENRALLRILGHRLLQARQPQLAVPVFEQVLRLAPHEPQSHRDLGLALADAGQAQAAIDQLWRTARMPATQGRFPDIDLTALADMNALIARAQRHGETLDTRAIDPRLLGNLPLGLRVVLAWDADNTDIDLHVTDPDGDTAYYGRPRTRQGGRMSADFTGGYGPEEFALRRPKPGVYTVSARFYGHRQQLLSPATTLMLRLTTGFGTAAEQEQRVMLRLAGSGDMVKVGEFSVAPAAALATD